MANKKQKNLCIVCRVEPAMQNCSFCPACDDKHPLVLKTYTNDGIKQERVHHPDNPPRVCAAGVATPRVSSAPVDPVAEAIELADKAWAAVQAHESKYDAMLHRKIYLDAAMWYARAILLVARATAAGFTDNLLQAHLSAAKFNLKQCKTGRGWAKTKLDAEVFKWIKKDQKTVENCYNEVSKMFYLWEQKQQEAA